MTFSKCLLNGMVKPFSEVDQMFQSQGFSRRGNRTVTYNIRIADAASNTAYYLRIPTRRTENKDDDTALLRLEQPYIGKLQGPDRFQPAQQIPQAVIEAAQHKVAEIASYLQSVKH